MAKKKQTKKMKVAVEKHRTFLKKMGLSEKTVAKNKPSNFPRFLLENIPASYSNGLSNTVEGNTTAGSKKGILSDVINYTEADRKIAREMAKQVAPEYNKGAYQYISKEADLTTLGKKV